MATTFLAGVANADIFKGDSLFATAKTLIDSSITIGVSAEDIRAGQGAKLYGKYFHTSTFDLKLSDAMFKLEYIAANVGSEITIGGDVFTEEVQVVSDAGTIILSTEAVPMRQDGEVYAYVKKPTDSFYQTVLVNEDKKTVKVPETMAKGQEVCVKYLYTNDLSRKLIVGANFTPDTVSVYLTANLYSGDAANPSTGTKVGTVTIKVPRFLLSGSQELSMSMTGASNTAFEGSALASGGHGCDNDGIYAEIIEVVDNRTADDILDIIIADSEGGLELEVDDTETLEVYVAFRDVAPILLSKDVSFTSDNTDIATVDAKSGLITAIGAGKATITAEYEGKTATITVTVA